MQRCSSKKISVDEKINEGTYKEMQEIQKQVVEEYLKTLPNETN